MKVLFFSSYMATPHFETELELMEEHLKKGDEIIQIVCNGILKSCYANIDKNEELCKLCISKRKLGVELLSKPVQVIDIVKYIDKNLEIKLPFFRNLEELTQINHSNFDIGYAVKSTLVDFSRKSLPEIDENELIIKKIFLSGYEIYFAFEKLLLKLTPSLVYTFNGRTVNEKAVQKVCEKLNINYFSHERGNSKEFYEIFENSIPHLFFNKSTTYNDFWDTGVLDKVKIANEFYQNKIKGLDKNWLSFTQNQTLGKLPLSWDFTAHNIVIYNSTEFENASLGKDWEFPYYKNQNEAIITINNFFNVNKMPVEFKIYLRIHPNIKDNFHEEEDLITLLGENLNIEIISSKSDVSTYELMKNASKVVSFGSTTGIEATWFRKPSILYGLAFYEELGATYNVYSVNELVHLMLDIKLPPKSLEGTLKYAYYVQSFGKPFKYYRPKTLFSGCFKGVDLNEKQISETFFTSIKNKILRIINR